jgi:DNA-binding HxlR family transcriptional regulator
MEYGLTPRGETLKPVVNALCRWGVQQGGAQPPEGACRGKKCPPAEERA